MPKKKFVEFLFPGMLFSESREAPYKKGMAIPKGCFAYRLFSRAETMRDGERLVGKNKYDKGTLYPKGSIVTKAADVPRVYRVSEHVTLRWNVECNKYKAVVMTPIGNMQPFDPAVDKVLPGRLVV